MIFPRHIPLGELWPGPRWLLWWWLLLFGWFGGLLLCGCRTGHPTPRESLVQRQQDTAYQHHQRHDSVFVFRNVEWDYRRAEAAACCGSAPTASAEASSSTKRSVGGSTDGRCAPPDTLIIRETTVEHHYQWIRDTLYRLQRDSVPYAVPLIEEHEVRYVPWYAKLLSAIGLLALMYLFFRGNR